MVGITIPSVFGQIGPNYQPTFYVDYKSIVYDVLYLGVVPAAIIILVVIVIKKMRRKK
jgi:hypothetical protein